MSDTATITNAEDRQQPQNQKASISGDKIADERSAATAAEVIQKNTPPSSPFEPDMCSLQSSPSKVPKATESTAGGDVSNEASLKTDEPDNKANVVASTSGEGTIERDEKETSVTKLRDSNDQQTDTTNVPPPPTDEGGLSTPSENVDSATDDTVIADAAAKVEISDDQKKQTKKDKDVADNKKGSNEGNKKATNINKKKDRSPLRSRANRRHNNSGPVNNNYNRGQQATHYGSRTDYRGDYRGGSYNNYNNSRYNGYSSGGYRQNSHYPRVTVQNNYGLRSPPYKSNFEPSDSARKKADEFVRASVGTM